MDTDFSQKRFPWLRSGFDLEGWLGALAAWLIGILLGIIWGPLFWIGVAAALIILMATRTAERIAPSDVDLLVAPTDGTIVSIGGAIPPSELRLEGENWTRIRVSIGPMASNGVYAPIDGAVDHIIREVGDPSAFAASRVDRPGLAIAYIAFDSDDRAVGLRLATGGLGPRLEIDTEAGDAVRLGRHVGVIRMGGWCDLYVPNTIDLKCWPGQTLVSSETVLATFGNSETAAPTKTEGAEPVTEPEPHNETAPEPDLTPKAEDDASESEEAESETVEDMSEDVSDEDDEDDEVSEMLQRLRDKTDDNT